MGLGRRGVRFHKEKREWRLPVILYGEEDLGAIVGSFVELCRKRGQSQRR